MEDAIAKVTVSAGVAPEIDQIGTYVPVPGMGVLPVHCFVVHAREPMLVDAGVRALARETLEALRQTIDLSTLRYVYVTHTDPDHVGCLTELLEEAPRARVVTTFLGMGKLGLSRPLAPERVLLLNPGQSLDLGDRRVTAGRPLSYDAPETTWLHDLDGDVLFSSDCFGAVLPRPFAWAHEVPRQGLREGLVAWTGIDAPWLATQDRAALRRRLGSVKVPGTVLGAHLPPAQKMGETLLEDFACASEVEPPPLPDHSMLETLLKSA